MAGPALAHADDAAAPIAAAGSASTAAGTAVSIPLRGTSSTGEALTYQLALFASYGDVSLSGSTAVYTPQSGFSGSDHFAFVVTDSHGTSTPVNVSISVAAPVVVAPPVTSAPAAPAAPAPVASAAPSTSTPTAPVASAPDESAPADTTSATSAAAADDTVVSTAIEIVRAGVDAVAKTQR
ncbi:Ig-like domain-containing protein [Schumannella sp. 10F1B-5-1]|uniref:Ig-like domain-containing protein n=1 Tax=Schumannella sp. 10F1B-5-1 TaxID=2590780 RepID=UPI001131CD8C|nr:Ig-like domain-containing protein [Schumannella sp. 10F1B-5-1]TPW70833.1 hypothetical protein FJ658_11990 [Schumannella sp. 10F1B-5-1]